jgi:integration host factor subunit alpha
MVRQAAFGSEDYSFTVKSFRKMTLSKDDIVKSVMQNVRFKSTQKPPQRFLFPEMDCLFLTHARARDIVNCLFETIKKTLARGEDVRIAGFGKFQVKFKWARKGRNPQTGEMIILRSRRNVTFRASPKLKEKINPPNKGGKSGG